MFKWLGKQFAYGRIYLWAKERLSGLLLTIILLILVFYIHSEYLNYIEFKSENEATYIGLSFVIKNNKHPRPGDLIRLPSLRIAFQKYVDAWRGENPDVDEDFHFDKVQTHIDEQSLAKRRKRVFNLVRKVAAVDL